MSYRQFITENLASSPGDTPQARMRSCAAAWQSAKNAPPAKTSKPAKAKPGSQKKAPDPVAVTAVTPPAPAAPRGRKGTTTRAPTAPVKIRKARAGGESVWAEEEGE